MMLEFADRHPVLFGLIVFPLVITFCTCIFVLLAGNLKRLDK